ncbi:translation initiation factor IF-2-like [Boleophthalmus pectinirostris]|uniref:translation initiation factor IF-2-like n=1 Tax=Boleophthalmus pectinirostris TaxID=150288 RepID=UPI0024328DAD|nr:translation initiation factor IF-2-like [Boleophthalmus pectinirostris]
MIHVQLCVRLLALCGMFSRFSSELLPNVPVLRVKPGANVTLHCPLVDTLRPTAPAPESPRPAPDQSSPRPVRVLTWYRWRPEGSPEMVLSLDLDPWFRFERRSGPGFGQDFRPGYEPGSGLESNEVRPLESVLGSGSGSGPGFDPTSEPRPKPELEPVLESDEVTPQSGPGSEPTSEPRSKPESEPGSGLESDEAPPRSGPTLGPGSRLGSGPELSYVLGSGGGSELRFGPESEPGSGLFESEPGSGLFESEPGPGFRSRIKLGSGSGLGSRVSVRSDGSLVLRRSELEDSGRYFCGISDMNDRERGKERWKRRREEGEKEKKVEREKKEKVRRRRR